VCKLPCMYSSREVLSGSHIAYLAAVCGTIFRRPSNKHSDSPLGGAEAPLYMPW
jgi:hypothetical protein